MSSLNELKQLGLKGMTFAFVLSGGGCTPKWNGQLPINDPSIVGPIKQYTSAGGGCIVSFGGAVAPYLENSCSSADQLAGAYKAVIDATGCNNIDLDMESHLNNIDMINQALKKLQGMTGCGVSFTLAADENGLNSMGMRILNNAKSQGVNVDTVNPMCMNFRPSESLDSGVIKCARSVYKNIVSVWGSDASYSMLGITPMIGTQDTGAGKDVFTLSGMHQLVQWSQQNGAGHLAFWSLNRDNGGCPGNKQANWGCSGVSQNQWDFTRAILPFCSGSSVIKPHVPDPILDNSIEPSNDGKNTCNSGSSSAPFPGDCTKFYLCDNGSPTSTLSCGVGTVYNPSSKICDWPYNVPGCSD